MKTFKNILTALLVFFSAASFAQGNLEEVIYLKDGSVYRGTIMETIPNESYKIQIAGGSIFTVRQSDVMKITKEERRYTDEQPAPGMREPMDPISRMERYHSRSRYDSTRIPNYKKKRGFFFLGEVRLGPGNGGIRVVNGVKVGRFGYFGIGVGIDGANFSDDFLFGDVFDNGQGSTVSDGVYLPLYLRYSGDILRTRVTPFYYVEAGFAAHPKGNLFFNDNENRSWGGPMGAVGFGCKFNSRHRVNFNVNLNVNFRSNYFRERYYTYDQNGNTILIENRQWDRRLFGALGFGIGF